MEDVFGTEHATLSTKDFPIVLVKETGELSNDERIQLLDLFHALLDTGESHSLILDLTEAGELSEEQRIFVAETLQLRADVIAELWTSVALLVVNSSGAPFSPEDPKAGLVSFWQSVAGVPIQVFTNKMSATMWTRQALEKRAQGTELDAGAEETAEPPPASREKVRARLSNPPRKAAARPPRWQKQTASRSRRYVVLGAAFLVPAFAAVWIFLVPSAEASRFAKHKGQIAMRVFKKGQRGDIELKDAMSAPKERIRFEADLPTSAYLLLFGVRPTGKMYVAFPEGGYQSIGPILDGKGVRIPASVELDERPGTEWFHLVLCPEKIRTKDCTAKPGGSVLECPSSCVIKSLKVEKLVNGT